MKILKSQGDLSSVKPGPLLWEGSGLAQMEEELAAVYIVHHHVELVLGLEGVPELDDKRILHATQYLSFCLSMVPLVPLLYDLLSKTLHREDVPRLLV